MDAAHDAQEGKPDAQDGQAPVSSSSTVVTQSIDFVTLGMIIIGEIGPYRCLPFSHHNEI